MNDGITYITERHNPIIYEGKTPAGIIVINAGPSSIEVLGWETLRPSEGQEPEIRIKLWPGNMRSVSANLIRATLYSDGPNIEQGAPYSAIGWRIAQ